MTKLVIKNVRLAAYPHLFEPNTGPEGKDKPAWDCKGIVPKNHPQVAEINALIKAEAKAKWKGEADTVLAELFEEDRVFFREATKKDAKQDGMAGNMRISCRNSENAPDVRHIEKDPTTGKPKKLVKADGKPYGGCYVNLVLDVWAQANKFGKRINGKLLGIQFIGDGDAFGPGAPATDDDFDLAEGADASNDVDESDLV
jgi:hypothetical protein